MDDMIIALRKLIQEHGNKFAIRVADEDEYHLLVDLACLIAVNPYYNIREGWFDSYQDRRVFGPDLCLSFEMNGDDIKDLEYCNSAWYSDNGYTVYDFDKIFPCNEEEFVQSDMDISDLLGV